MSKGKWAKNEVPVELLLRLGTKRLSERYCMSQRAIRSLAREGYLIGAWSGPEETGQFSMSWDDIFFVEGWLNHRYEKLPKTMMAFAKMQPMKAADVANTPNRDGSQGATTLRKYAVADDLAGRRNGQFKIGKWRYFQRAAIVDVGRDIAETRQIAERAVFSDTACV